MRQLGRLMLTLVMVFNGIHRMVMRGVVLADAMMVLVLNRMTMSWTT